MPPTKFGRIWLGLAAVVVGLAAGPTSSASEAPSVELPPSQAVVLPRTVLFDPLLADPRWTHFSSAWHGYGGDEALDNVASASLGEDFSFYEDSAAGGRWGVGLQAGVFAIFDLDADSRDLVNADYWVAIPLSWRGGPWQARARAFHQSSHLGDEFLLRTRLRRINLSYEGVDLKLSRQFMAGTLRLYGGAGYLLHRIPADLDPWMVQVGVEYRAPWKIAGGLLRPVAALDVQSSQEAQWHIDTSARVGVMIESSRDRNYQIMLSLEHFRGRNPNGQFYGTTVDYYGVGVHVYF